MRVRLAQVLALAAILASLVGALGPAREARTIYSWPPRTLPTGTPSHAWYTPLLLIRHVPEAMTATIPCRLPPALAAAPRPVTVLATARFPDKVNGLSLTRGGNLLSVQIGSRVLRRMALAGRPAGRECAYHVGLGDGRWSIFGGPAGIDEEGSLEQMPAVTGLFSALDLRSGTTPSIEVTTSVHSASAVARQTIAWTIAALAASIALVLVALEAPLVRRGHATPRALPRAATRTHPADAAVVAMLLGWWLISPAFFDDGWVMARQSMFSAARGFSNYYDTFGANLPLGYWLEWTQHWLTQSTTAVLVLRLPALACMAATWVLCRWVLGRIVQSSNGAMGHEPWALASAFSIFALAWGMTLRPESVTALLVTGVLGCVVWFRERPVSAPIALSALLVPLAVSAHPAGLVSLAPLIAAAPTLLRWARPRLREATTIVAASSALLVVLLFVGSDLAQRRDGAEVARTYGNSANSPLDELTRYDLLSQFQYGTPLRRASVALIVLAILGLLLMRRRGAKGLQNLPAAALGVAVILLAATPSKWPSHFGTLTGLTAIAVATETARIRAEAAGSRNWRVWPFLGGAAAMVAVGWSWQVRNPWNALDLSTLQWTLAFEDRLPLTAVATAVPAVMLAIALLGPLVGGHRADLPKAPWRAVSWTAPALAIPLIAFTAGILVADTAKTSTWTFARQNIEAVAGDQGCGLADELLVPARSSNDQPLAEQMNSPGSRSLVFPSLLSYFPCTRLPSLSEGIVEVPQIIVVPRNPLSPLRYPLTSPFLGLLDVYALRPLPLSNVPKEFVVYEVDQRIPGFKLAPPLRTTSTSQLAYVDDDATLAGQLAKPEPLEDGREQLTRPP